VMRSLGAGGEFWEILFRERTLDILWRTVILVISVTALSLVVALPLAWLTTRSDLPFRRMWAVLSIIPLVIPSYVAGLVVVAAFGPKGTLQDLLEGPFGVDRLPNIYGFPGAVLTITMVSFPYMLLVLRASMQRMDRCMEEASRSLGHGPFSTFRKVTLPHLRPSIAAGALLVSLYTMSDFGAVSLLRYETFTWAIYLQYETSFDRMVAAALSLVLVLIAVVILVIELRMRGRAQYHRSAAGVAHTPVIVRLGRWRWPALGFSSLVVLISLVIPVSILLYWTIRGVSEGESISLNWDYAFNSAYASGIAALVTVAAALPVAILAVRYSGRLSSLLERATYIGFAMPGVVVGLALVFFATNYADFVYQTMALLIFAYVISFLPQAVGAIRASLLQVNPRLEEASRSLGRNSFRTTLSVTIPLIRPGMMAGAALVFLTVMKELPATLILSPFGFKTLATSIWSSTSEAFFARAAISSLLLILVSSVPMAYFVIRDGGRKGEHE